MKNNSSRRVLVCAYSCEPGFSSEREIGWKWSLLLSEFNDVHVLTRESNRNNIESFLRGSNKNVNIKFIYYDLPKWARLWKKAERGLYLYYTLWQIGALVKALSVHRTERFHITHYVTFGSVLLPSFMFLMPTKYVFGPVGGGENVPLRFIGEFSFKGKVAEIIRHTFQALQLFNPIFLLQCMKADKIFARTRETYLMIPSRFRRKAELMLETGMPEELIYRDSLIKAPDDEVVIVTVGRFIHSKINLLTLKVVSEFKRRYGKPFKYIIVGDGYERKSLEAYVSDNGLSENVVFTGWVERGDVFRYLSQSDIFFSTTFKEGGTWAFFEAVAMGIPVVCLKISGPDMIVADGCGIKVKPSTPSSVICEMADGLMQLAMDASLRSRLSICAREELLRTHTWPQMMKRVDRIYQELIGGG